MGFKPIASGAEHAQANSDVLTLQKASSCCAGYAQHNIHTFLPAIAPHWAAKLEGTCIDSARMSAQLALWRSRCDWVLVEGAGGWHTPLSQDDDFSDWVASEGLAVVLVVGLKLGALNHALLSARAIRDDGLKLAGWVANTLGDDLNCTEEYVSLLSSRLNMPPLAVMPYLPAATPAQMAAHIDLSSLISDVNQAD